MWVLFLFEHRHLKVFARWFLKLFTSGLNVCSSANIIKWVFLGTGSFSFILEFLLQAYFGRKNYLLCSPFLLPHAYSLIQFLCPAIWKCSSEWGLRQGKFELLSRSDNGAITDPVTEPKVWISFCETVSSHLARSSFFKPLDSGSSQEQFYLASLYA